METFALDSSIYRQFFAVVASLLGVGGATLLTLKRFAKADLSSVFATYRSWLVIAPLPFLVILCGREVTIGSTLLLSVLAFREYSLATKLCPDRWITGLVFAAIGVQAIFTLMPDPWLATSGWYGMFIVMPVYVMGALVISPILRNRVDGQLRQVSLAVFGYLYFGWMFGHFAFLANAPNATGYLLYLTFAVAVADVSAFTCGKAFGKRKLRDQISPNKTMGGSVGSLAVSMALPWAMGFALPGFTPAQKILTGVIVGVGGQLGDLTISYIKRDLGIKDMGRCIPGHGGLLDRIDSLIFTAPLFFHMVRWFGGI